MHGKDMLRNREECRGKDGYMREEWVQRRGRKGWWVQGFSAEERRV